MERLELERQEQAAYHDHGRHHFASEKLAVSLEVIFPWHLQ